MPTDKKKREKASQTRRVSDEGETEHETRLVRIEKRTMSDFALWAKEIKKIYVIKSKSNYDMIVIIYNLFMIVCSYQRWIRSVCGFGLIVFFREDDLHDKIT